MSENISNRAKTILNKEEGYDVDYKRDLKGLSVDDLVAFANSSTGGAILIGVDEDKDDKGRQVGKVVGCKIGDNEKLAIVQKANNCRPPVDVEIFLENEAETPFYRIEIPTGEFKPYSTHKGTYVIRGDASNLPLSRDKLLHMFLNEQGETFINRFKQATEDLEESIDDTNRKLDMFDQTIDNLQWELSSDIENITDNLDNLTDNVEQEFSSIVESVRNTESLADESLNYTMETVGEIIDKIKDLDLDINETKLVTNSILEHLGIEHPYTTNYKSQISGLVKVAFSSWKDIIIRDNPSANKEQIISEYKKKKIEMFTEFYEKNAYLSEQMIF
ncbi:AlbA family DNA-binding domain-containing protein [Oceanobacillus salinisoli]|uniref:AlbA family DNA-binding domain-containing protein n=1 Tax=Oceanobacillus salinisoli TaxID=2678611 RepID=UPI0018CC6698|nr:ATP-binding protein [Oceanobacillus salinisoli]